MYSIIMRPTTPWKSTLLGCVVLIHLSSVRGNDYVVRISHDGPIVQGASITFQAEIYSSDGTQPEGKFRFNWMDNTMRPHSITDETNEPRSNWTVQYPAVAYYPGEYEVQVNVDKSVGVIFWRHICSRRTTFNITAFLNGRLELIQDNPIKSNFVSNASKVQHDIVLSDADNYFLKNATEVTTYWFIDCVFYGQSENFAFNYTYNTVGANYSIEALVVASFEPITTTPAPTTTSTSTTTSTTSTTSSPHSTTPVSSNATLTPVTKKTFKMMNTSNFSTTKDLSFPINHEQTFNHTAHLNVPYVCLNSSIIPPDPKKIYGYFHRQINVRSPIHNISIKGTNWLQQYELLDLQVLCDGSGLFRHCFYKKPADYNVTGKETCLKEKIDENCQFNVSKYYSYENYTMIIIISNDVSKIVYPVSVILYKVQKHAQLSVIVVPVVCSLVAVIMIVFGVAYYVQSRKRFTVEVADFNFGQGGGDMEYKTFRERLRESVVNSFNRDLGAEGEGNVWSPSRKYGIME